MISPNVTIFAIVFSLFNFYRLIAFLKFASAKIVHFLEITKHFAENILFLAFLSTLTAFDELIIDLPDK